MYSVLNIHIWQIYFILHILSITYIYVCVPCISLELLSHLFSPLVKFLIPPSPKGAGSYILTCVHECESANVNNYACWVGIYMPVCADKRSASGSSSGQLSISFEEWSLTESPIRWSWLASRHRPPPPSDGITSRHPHSQTFTWMRIKSVSSCFQ